MEASFSQKTYTVTAVAGDGGSVIPPEREVAHGQITTFTVTADTGYSTDEVTGCGGSLSGDIYTTGPITGACTVNATFSQKTYTVTATAGEGGSINPASRAVLHGQTTTFTVTADTGYSTDEVTGCGGSLSGDIYTTGPITGACTVNATFSQKTYTVTATAGDGGSIAPASRTVNHGESTTFTVTPDAGYGIATVSGCGGSLSDNIYTTGVITSDCTVEAAFINIPTATGLIGPFGYISTTSPEFTWQPVSGATRYHLWINNAEGKRYHEWYSSEAAGCLEGESPCRITPELDFELGRYTWWIQTANETAEGKWSAGMVFNVYDPDKMAAFIGSWPDSGTWRYDLATARWQRLTIDAQQLAVGDLDGDGRGDLAGVWPSGLWFKPSTVDQWVYLTHHLPHTFTMGDLNADGRDDIVGSWPSGVWYWSSLDQEWLRLTIAARLLATGKVREDGADVLAGIWNSGLWFGQNEDWQHLTSLPATALAVGDLTGDGQLEVIGSWPDYGVWYWDTPGAQWIRLTHLPAAILAAGDLTGNGQDELVGVWEDSGVWLYHWRERQWEQLTPLEPAAIAVGRLSAETADSARGIADSLISEGDVFQP